MSLSPQFLDELRLRTTLSTLIGKSVKVVKAGREYKACCPFHNEKTPSFTINDEKGFYHCFGCGAHGDAIRWLTDQRGLVFMDAVKELADAAGLALPAPDPRAARKAEAARTLHDVMAAAQGWFVAQLAGIEGAEARAYLERRGIDAETRDAFGFGFAPDSRSKLKAALKDFDEALLVEAGMLIRPDGTERETYDRFRGRLMIPIRDARGRVIAFGGRILGTGEPKYLNSPDTPLFDKGRTLYNLDKAAPAARKTDRMIVVEGYMDVIALAQAGFAECVAPLGTALTEHQIEKLWSMVECPVLCLDGDSAGQKAADRAMLRALPMLRPDRSLDIVTLPTGIDPDDLVRKKGPDAFALVLKAAQPLAERLWRYELAQGGTDTPERRAGLKQRLIDRASAIENELVGKEYRSQLLNRFFENFGWRKAEINAVRRTISAIRDEMADNKLGIMDRIMWQNCRAILLGVSRRPPVLYSHREKLNVLDMPSRAFEQWRDVLISASYSRPALEEDLIEAILADSEGDPVERRNFQHDMGFSFYHRSAEPDVAESDLCEVIDRLVIDQEMAAKLATLEAGLYAAVQDDEAYKRYIEERHRLLTEKQRNDERLIELKANAEDRLAAA